MNVLVVGLGEVGKPLLDILSEVYTCYGKDVQPVDISEKISVMHICYPYEVGDFVETTSNHVAEYKPQLTIVHSTVAPGTTRRISEESGRLVVYSPIRGKHRHMRRDLLSYTKFVAGLGPESSSKAVDHLRGAGIKTETASSPEALELSKLIETTYLGLLIAWAQEVERFGRALDVNYEEVMSLARDVPYFPSVTFQPGFIGGHCVIPNIHLLEQVRASPFTEAIRTSNERKREGWLRVGRKLSEQLVPKLNE